MTCSHTAGALQVNWMGTFVFTFYICAFGFYLWIRIAKTLDLGQYLPYGIFVLFVECMGATTVVLYGTNLLWNPVNEIVLQESEDGISPGKLKVTLYSRQATVLLQCLRLHLHFDCHKHVAPKILHTVIACSAVMQLTLYN